MRIRLHDTIELGILRSRWLLVPLLFALMYEIVVVTGCFFRVVVGAMTATELAEQTIQALQLLDITMIANLIWLIAAGSYFVFVDDTYPAAPKYPRPRCLVHLSTGILKEKMAGSLIGVSSVHLLQLFLQMSESDHPADWQKILVLLGIHSLFIVGLLVFAYTNGADHHQHDEGKKTDEKAATTPLH